MRSGWKSSSASHFSPVPISLMGLPVTVRMESAAPPRPSPSMRVRTMPVIPTRSSKLLASFTASWPVRLSATSSVSCGCAMSRTSLASRIELVVDVRAPGRVEQEHVETAEPGGIERTPGDLLRRLARDDCERLHLGLLAQDTQLLLRRRPAHVERGHQHFLLVAVGKPVADLGAGRGLAGALQSHQHDGDGRLGRQIDRRCIRAQHGDQLVVHDLDHHLARRDRLDHVLADGLGLHLVGELAHHLQRHVGLEQRPAHLAHGFRHVAVGERPAPRELVEDARQAI